MGDKEQEKQAKEEEEKKRQKMTRIARMKIHGRERDTPEKILHIFWKINFSGRKKLRLLLVNNLEFIYF